MTTLSNPDSALIGYVRSKIDHFYNPESLFGEVNGLRESWQIPHKGLYIGIISCTGEPLARDGFLRYSENNVVTSVDMVCDQAFSTLKAKGVTRGKFVTSTVYLCIVKDLHYMPNPLSWDENSDGLFFQWGQRYKGLYLPYEIKRMGVSKVDILDRLCCWEAGLVSNLWKEPEGCVWRMSVKTITA